MITIDRSFPVNEPGELVLDRSDVWEGLEMKARNALPFVRRMQSCVVIEDRGRELIRDIVVRDESHREHVTLTPESTVRFDRIGGSTTGYITNEIQDDADRGLVLRFTFNLGRKDMEPGGPAERSHFAKVESEYEDAIRTTLATIRRMRSETTEPGLQR